jgi:hypothetical protein
LGALLLCFGSQVRRRQSSRCSLALGNGTLYAANESSAVTAVWMQDGAILWKANNEGIELEMTVVGAS